MENRKGAKSLGFARANSAFSLFYFLFSVSFLIAGCGVPGEPVPPSPPIPVAVSDLTVRQVGDGVLLTFTPPNKSTRGQRLTELPTLEILRGSLKADGTPDLKSFRVVDTVPGPLLSGYEQQGKIQFLEPIPPEEARALPGETAVYQVRTRVSERKSSPVSNDASLNLYPVPLRIETLETLVTENSIQLKWAAPARSSSGEPLSGIHEYHVYRGELDPASAPTAEKDLHAANWRLSLLQIAATETPEYQDTGFDFGKTYVYVVRSVVSAGGGPLESADSHPAIVTPKDIFPPAAPQDVVAAVLPGASAGTYMVDLSWAINVETDLAGYRIYRSEREDERGMPLEKELLLSPAFRDGSARSRGRYWYSVTAVDRAGNESASSAAVLVEIP
jgi:hypothetical protein